MTNESKESKSCHSFKVNKILKNEPRFAMFANIIMTAIIFAIMTILMFCFDKKELIYQIIGTVFGVY